MRSLSLKSKVLATFLLLGACAISLTTWQGQQVLRQTLEESALQRLTALRDNRKQVVEDFFISTGNTAQLQAASPWLTNTLPRLIAGYQALPNELPATPEQFSALRDSMAAYYTQQYVIVLEPQRYFARDDFSPSENASVLLQAQFLTNRLPVVETSRYARSWSALRPRLSAARNRIGLKDILIVDARSGNVLYSDANSLALGVNLQSIAWSNTAIGEAYEAARALTAGTVSISDLTWSSPFEMLPSMFISTPIMQNDAVVGVLMYEVALARINRLMQTPDDGTGISVSKTEDVFIVGENLGLRSDPRLLRENKAAYLDAMRNHTRMAEAFITAINVRGTATVVQTVRTPAVKQVLHNGATGVETGMDFLNRPAYCAFAPLQVGALQWGVIAEMTVAEALSAGIAAGSRLIITAVIILIFFALLGAWASTVLVRPIQKLTQGTRNVAVGDLSHIGAIPGGDEFGQLAQSFNEMVDQLQLKTVTRDYVNSILSSMSDALIVTGPVASDRNRHLPSARIQTVNNAACLMLGMSEGEMHGLSVAELFTDAEGTETSWLMRLLQEKDVAGMELTCRTQAGVEVPVILSGSLLEGLQGRYGGVVLVLHDITERKMAEDLLRENERRLRRHSEVLQDLVKCEQMYKTLNGALREVTETAARTMGVRGSGVWLLTPDRRKMQCVDQYDAETGEHKESFEMCLEDFPEYFHALDENRVLAAQDVQDDPRLKEFSDDDLNIKGEQAWLDAPIHLAGKTAGVLSFTHVGSGRKWLPEELSFAASMAELVSTAVEMHQRRRAESALEQHRRLDEVISEISTNFIRLGPMGVESGIAYALQKVGEITNADGCYIVQSQDDCCGESDITHEWTRDGSLQVGGSFLHRCCIGAFPWLDEEIRNEKTLIFSDLSELPESARADRKLLEEVDVRSLVMAPIMYRDDRMGFLGMYTRGRARQWPEEITTLLHMVCNILANSMTHYRREIALQNRMQFEDLLTRISTNFINVSIEEVEASIKNALQQLGDFTKADVTFVLTVDEFVVQNLIGSGAGSLKEWIGIDLQDFPWWTHRLLRAQDIPIPSVRDLPYAASAERKQLLDAGLQSLLVVPMFYGTEFRGFFGIGMTTRERMWGDDFRNLLTIVSQTFVNVLEHERVQRELHYRIDFENLITDISTRFITLAPEELNDGFQDSLGLLGEFVGADRSYIFQFRDNLDRMDNTHEWCAETIPTVMAEMQNIARESVPWFMAHMLRKDVFHVPAIAEIPADGHREQAMFQSHNIQSMMVVPIIYGEVLLGFLGFDMVRRPHTWSMDHIKLLRIVGEIFANALEHKWAQEALQLANEELERKVEHRTMALKEKQAQLVQSEKMASLGQLVAGVAHEINTPLGAIKSNNDVVYRSLGHLKRLLKSASLSVEKDSPPGLTKLFETMHALNQVDKTAAERIVVIVNSLRTFARLDQSDQDTVDLHEGLESTLTLVHHQLKNRVDVIRDYDNLPPVTCHPNQINQVFMNVLVNASQAIDGKGKIYVRTYLQKHRAVVEIEDTGGGIRPEDQTHIFDPGYTTKGVGVGTGLGLSIVYQIVRDHHGDIEVDSAPGKGTVFRIMLPVDSNENNG
jgi:PAS domain S-box-containing protein